MDYEKLIEQLKGISNGLAEDEFPKCANAVRQAATALYALQAENEKLRAELERMKEIMREDGIMVIPSKYPGGPAEWNIPKPNVQKED